MRNEHNCYIHDKMFEKTLDDVETFLKQHGVNVLPRMQTPVDGERVAVSGSVTNDFTMGALLDFVKEWYDDIAFYQYDAYSGSTFAPRIIRYSYTRKGSK